MAISTARVRAEMETGQHLLTWSWAEFAAMHHATYEQFATTQQDSCEEELALTRYTHQYALVGVAILEEKMVQMSHSLSHWHLGSHWCSGSCQCTGIHRCQRSQSSGWWREDPQVMSCHGDAHSPSQQKKHVTFTKGRPPCHPMIAWKKMPECKKPTRCPSWPGKLRAWCRINLTGQGQREEKS